MLRRAYVLTGSFSQTSVPYVWKVLCLSFPAAYSREQRSPIYCSGKRRVALAVVALANRSGRRGTGRVPCRSLRRLRHKNGSDAEATATESDPDPGLMQRIERNSSTSCSSSATPIWPSPVCAERLFVLSLASRNEVNRTTALGMKPSFSRDLKEVSGRAPASRRLEQISIATILRTRCYGLSVISRARLYAGEYLEAARRWPLMRRSPEKENTVSSPEYATFFQMIEPGGESAGLGFALVKSKRRVENCCLPVRRAMHDWSTLQLQSGWLGGRGRQRKGQPLRILATQNSPIERSTQTPVQ